MNIDTFGWRFIYVLFVVACYLILQYDGIQRPAFVRSGHFLQDKMKTRSLENFFDAIFVEHMYLSHGRQETLRIEKSRHPKYLMWRKRITMYFFLFRPRESSTTHFRSIGLEPCPELSISFQQFGVPETECGRFP